MQIVGCHYLFYVCRIFKGDSAGLAQRFALAPVAPGLSYALLFIDLLYKLFKLIYYKAHLLANSLGKKLMNM
jgi:hypothetical protein